MKKHFPIILCICIFAVIGTILVKEGWPKRQSPPQPGEIWRSNPKADIPDVRIDSVTSGMVHYTLLGDHPQFLDTCSEAVSSFMQSCHKVGEVKPERP